MSKITSTDPPEKLPEAIDMQQVQPTDPVRVPLYRRNLFPTNLILSAKDLKEFCELLVDANQRSKELEYGKLDLSTFDSPEQARQRINELMPIEYNYTAGNGDSMQGLGVPKTDERTFPDDLQSIFVSNAAIRREPPRVYRRVEHSKDEPYDKASTYPRLSCRTA